MARYKPVDESLRFVAVNPAAQILPGSFEHALTLLIDKDVALEAFEARFKNDEVGAPAYSPAVLLKIVLLAYSKGIVRSREIEALCKDNVLFNAISGDSQPHFTTIAKFISTQHAAIVQLFARVLVICNREGLIGRQMFAIDGVKLPSNASKAKSGRRADFERQAAKMQAQVEKILEHHRAADTQGDAPEGGEQQRLARSLERLREGAEQLREWLHEHPQERKGPNGKVRQSNRTDNESAKMATGKGVIQGYTGVAAVDEKHQIIVEAQAHGVGAEQELLLGVVDALKETGQLAPDTVLTTDAGYCSERGLQGLEQRGIDACIPDANWRKRDERFAGQQAHREKKDPLWDKSAKPDKARLFRPSDFQPAEDLSHCICPAGKRLYRNGQHRDLKGLQAVHFTGTKRDCASCPLRAQCLRKPDITPVRQVIIVIGRTPGKPQKAIERMKRKVDSERGRDLIARRFATVEPVFGNIRHNKRLDRFTLRGQQKIDGQWKLYCLVHNIEKLANNGYAR
jgi:transposase